MKRKNNVRHEVENPQPISVVDLTTLLFNLWEGSRNRKVGWEDASCTLSDMSRNLDGKLFFNENHLESALWSCNLMNERGRFKDIKERSFKQFVKSVFPYRSFNTDYNFLEGDKPNV